MNDFEKAEQALEYIQKKVDIFDAICQAKKARPAKNAFGRFHILFFSRILFAGVMLKDKIATYFTSLDKIHAAQQDIRNAIGCNVDVVKNRIFLKNRELAYNNNSDVYLLYEAADILMDDYINSIERILAFCELHSIKYVFLSVDDIVNLFPNIDLSMYNSYPRSSILRIEEKDDEEDFLILDQEKLKSLLNKISSYRLDKRFIKELGQRITDFSVKKALENYEENSNIKNLQNCLLARLTLNLNSDSSFISKDLGKCHENISIHGEYVKIISTSEATQKSETSLMYLWEYLGFPSFELLLNNLNTPHDNEEQLLMAILYLYLNKQYSIKSRNKANTQSFYDTLYINYKNAQKDKSNTPTDMYFQKGNRISANVVGYGLAIYYTLIVLGTGVLGLTGIDFILKILNKENDESLRNQVIEQVITPYKISWSIEKDLILGAQNIVDDIKRELSASISSKVGDASAFGNSKEVQVALIEPLNDTPVEDLPSYYATDYGASSEYSHGTITYDLQKVPINYNQIYEAPYQEAFSVRVISSRKDLKKMIQDNYLNIPLSLYPVDGNYFITNVTIYDSSDHNKEFVIDFLKAHYDKGTITKTEQELLLSMKTPVIKFTYARAGIPFNSFSSSINKNGDYLSTDISEMRDVITASLNLPNDASYSEIFSAIKSKDYSLHPLKDGGLNSFKLWGLDEKEYIEKISSLDALICNLAATLAVETNEDLIYVTGFYASDRIITYEDAHAWAMDNEGTLVDVTPADLTNTDEEETSLIINVLVWAIKAKIPIIIALGLASYLAYLLLGKKIVFSIRKSLLDTTLSSPEMGDAYALINEIMYGKISLPIKRSKEYNLYMIMKDFEGYSKEELQELLNRINMANKEGKRTAKKIIKSVPFIKNNQRKLIRSYNKERKNPYR